MALASTSNLSSMGDVEAVVADAFSAAHDARRYNNLLGWTFDPVTASASVLVPAVATLYVAKVPTQQAFSATNIIVSLVALGAGTLTHSYALLYNHTGEVIGQSADQSATWGSAGSTGLKTISLASGPFTVTPTRITDHVFVGLYIGTNTAGALPKFQCGATNGGAALINAGLTIAFRSGSIAIADTATPGTFAPASLASEVFPFWAGIS